MEHRAFVRIASPTILLAALTTSGAAPLALADQKQAGPPSGIHVPAVLGMHPGRHDFTHVYYDEPGDGAIWARGASYKASFDRSGARVIPWLGAQAPADEVLSLVPSSLMRDGVPIAFAREVPAVRAGDSIAYERGSFVERYALNPGSIEQTFELAALSGSGDLVLRLESQTGLVPSEGVESLSFDSAQGGVIYGKATAINARGQHLVLSTHLAAGGIEIRVPDSFLDGAVYPVTIDPVISTFSVDISNSDDFSPDVAYDAVHDRYMVCYEEAFSATDHDVYEEILDATGSFVSAAYIDFTTDNWRHPRVANNRSASQFMVVAQEGTSPDRVIKARTATAATNSLGTQVLVAPAFSGFDQLNPDIGGDPAPSGNTLYIVVWEFVTNSTGESDIVQVGMKTSGHPDSGLSICIDCSSIAKDVNPAISKSAGLGHGHDHRWNVVWESAMFANDHDIWGVQLNNEAKMGNLIPVSTGTSDDRHPSVSSFLEGTLDPDLYMAVYDRDQGTDHDIAARVLNGPSLIISANLSSVEGPDFVGQDQLQPSVDSDGCAFVVAYSEQFSTSTTDYDVYVSTFNVIGPGVHAIEVHQNLAFSGQPETHPQITAAHGGPLLRYMAAWTREATGNQDIYGGLYDTGTHVAYCLPGTGYVTTCPCSNPAVGAGGCNNSAHTGGAILSATGTPSLSADSLSFTQQAELPNALSIFLQGTNDLAGGITYGGGVRCVGGTLKRLYTHSASSGVVSAPIGADLHVAARSAALGDAIEPCSSRQYQVYYRDPNLGFCPSGYNIGSGIRVLWLP